MQARRPDGYGEQCRARSNLGRRAIVGRQENVCSASQLQPANLARRSSCDRSPPLAVKTQLISSVDDVGGYQRHFEKPSRDAFSM